MASDELFRELKPDIEALTLPLFDASEALIRKAGAFLPHGAVLTTENEVRLVMAAPDGFEQRAVSAEEVLPLLHAALRESARTSDVKAAAVCEDVRITLPGQPQTRAMKVLFEHARGLCVGLYVPYSKRLLRGWEFSEMFAKSAEAEVRPSFGRTAA